MILRMDKLAIELPMPKHPSPPDLPEEAQLTAPDGPDSEVDPAFVAEMSKRVFGSS